MEAEEEGASYVRELRLHNLPPYAGVKQMRSILKQLGVNFKKVSCIGDGRADVKFESESVMLLAKELLDGKQIKGRAIRAAENEPRSVRAAHRQAERCVAAEATGGRADEQSMLEAVTPLQGVPYDEQLRRKQAAAEALLRETLAAMRQTNCAHQGKPDELLRAAVPCPEDARLYYRNKCEFTIGQSPEGAPTVGFVAGRFTAGRNFVLPVDNCCHIPEQVKRVVAAATKHVAESQLPPFDEGSRSGFWKMLTTRCFHFDLMLIITVDATFETDVDAVKRSLVARFLTRSDAFADDCFRVTSLYYSAQRNPSDTPRYELLGGAPYVFESLLGQRFRVSPSAFFQTNTTAAQQLYGVIGERCEADGALLVDLCCGTGTIGLCMAAAASGGRPRGVVGIEQCAEAVADARANAAANGLINSRFVCGQAEQVMSELKYLLPANVTSLEDARVVGVLDPPRAGMPAKLIQSLRHLRQLDRLVYVSCDPKGARKNFLDLCRPESNRFGGAPFRLDSVTPVDIFPQTYHCEWVIVFVRA